MFFNEKIETMNREKLDSIVEDRILYTVRYANENSPFYRMWFRKNRINPKEIRTHTDLLNLPIVNGKTIRKNQPPMSQDFQFKSIDWSEVFTIHETSGTSGSPKTFFLTWNDWERYAEKYARAFVSQGFGKGDRVVICASYGMNVGANTMTQAARKVGMTIIPEGKCTFPARVIVNYKPTGLVGSVFKFLKLARELSKENFVPSELGVRRLVVGGESFAEESRSYLAEVWGCDVFNTYGSTEGTMCGECTQKNGLHAPEDLVHLDVYNPSLNDFVKDAEPGRIILSTLLPVGGQSGNVLLNYDTEDSSMVLSRDRCACGRTHMKINYPQREKETFWIRGNPFNRVDVEKGVFQRENMEYLTGEYKVFLYGDLLGGVSTLNVNLECLDLKNCNISIVKENFLKGFFKFKPQLQKEHSENNLVFQINFLKQDELEIYKFKCSSKRLVDKRQP
ncbi:coenzyme F390 synthetase [Thermoproteota archaeon]